MNIDIKIKYKNERLQSARLAAGMSQAELSKASGIPVRTLQDFEQGNRDLNGAKLLTILEICLALGCKMSDILTDDETIKKLKKLLKNA